MPAVCANCDSLVNYGVGLASAEDELLLVDFEELLSPVSELSVVLRCLARVVVAFSPPVEVLSSAFSVVLERVELLLRSPGVVPAPGEADEPS